MTGPEIGIRTRHILNGDRIWILIAYFWLAAVVVALYFHQTEISKQEAARQAETQAKIAQCIQSIPSLRKIDRFVHGVREFHVIVALNSKAIVDSTPKTDPQYTVRVANYRRIRNTVADVSGVKFTVPTVAQCRKSGG